MNNNNDVTVPRINPSSDDWPTLLGSLLEDFTSILRGELKLLGASVEPGIESAILRGVNYLILALIGLYGILCLIGALILLFHKWLEWWQAFGATGLSVIIFAIVAAQMWRHRTTNAHRLVPL